MEREGSGGGCVCRKGSRATLEEETHHMELGDGVLLAARRGDKASPLQPIVTDS